MKILFHQKSLLVALVFCSAICAFTNVPAVERTQLQETNLQLTLDEILGKQEAQRYKKIIPTDELLSWQVYLPENDSDESPGLFVYVSPHPSGRIDARWRKVMDKQNLIYIGADNSGNRKPVNRRMVLATMAVKIAGQRFSFNTDRIIVSGFSGGGRVASILSTQYPEAFTGALYICGVDFWKKSRSPKVDRLIQNRFVFLTGSRDFNRNETRQIYHRYLKAGALNSKLIIVPNSAHELPNANVLAEALDYLSNRQ